LGRYYDLLTDLAPAQVEAERARSEPMASKMALARRIVDDFHGQGTGAAAEAEWSRVHRQGQAPSEVRAVALAPGRYKPHELLARAGLTRSKSEAVRLLRQGAVRRDGTPLAAGDDVPLEPGGSFVLSVGPARFVRVEAANEEPPGA
jgi:tyrosyl-tRNA synthetase